MEQPSFCRICNAMCGIVVTLDGSLHFSPLHALANSQARTPTAHSAAPSGTMPGT